MLERIKSRFFAKILFSYLDEKKKLKLVRYNKSLQKNLAISINNYLHFNGRYIIYESNGKGKEYSQNGELIYEGEFLQCEKNGKGIEYNINGLLMSYEGEYLNGKRSGKGKEYLYKTLLFEGVYLNNKRNGYLNGKAISGIKYDHNGNILYQFNNINGKGKEYYPNGQLSFEGEFLNCKKMEKEKNIIEMNN